MSLSEDESTKKTPKGAGGAKQYSGQLTWIEPFATKETQRLHLEIQAWDHEGQPALFLCVSPKAFTEPIWKQLREIRAGFRIE